MEDDWARPVVHWEIQAKDPDAMAKFYREMFNWTIGDGRVMGLAPASAHRNR